MTYKITSFRRSVTRLWTRVSFSTARATARVQFVLLGHKMRSAVIQNPYQLANYYYEHQIKSSEWVTYWAEVKGNAAEALSPTLWGLFLESNRHSSHFLFSALRIGTTESEQQQVIRLIPSRSRRLPTLSLLRLIKSSRSKPPPLFRCRCGGWWRKDRRLSLKSKPLLVAAAIAFTEMPSPIPKRKLREREVGKGEWERRSSRCCWFVEVQASKERLRFVCWVRRLI